VLPGLPHRGLAAQQQQFVFEFAPEDVAVELLDEADSRVAWTVLAVGATTRWRVPPEVSQADVVVVRANAAPGDVAYLAELESR
jgi:hypothetical protein